MSASDGEKDEESKKRIKKTKKRQKTQKNIKKHKKHQKTVKKRQKNTKKHQQHTKNIKKNTKEKKGFQTNCFRAVCILLSSIFVTCAAPRGIAHGCKPSSQGRRHWTPCSPYIRFPPSSQADRQACCVK